MGTAAVEQQSTEERKIVAKEVGPKNWTTPEWLNRLEKLFN